MVDEPSALHCEPPFRSVCIPVMRRRKHIRAIAASLHGTAHHRCKCIGPIAAPLHDTPHHRRKHIEWHPRTAHQTTDIFRDSN